MVWLYFLSVNSEFFYRPGLFPCCRLLLPPGSQKPGHPNRIKGPRNLPYPSANLTQLLSLPSKQHGARQSISDSGVFGLPSMGLHRVGHDWSDLAAAAAGCHQSPGILLICRFGFGRSRVALRFCISTELPGDAGLWTILWVARIK